MPSEEFQLSDSEAPSEPIALSLTSASSTDDYNSPQASRMSAPYSGWRRPTTERENLPLHLRQTHRPFQAPGYTRYEHPRTSHPTAAIYGSSPPERRREDPPYHHRELSPPQPAHIRERRIDRHGNPPFIQQPELQVLWRNHRWVIPRGDQRSGLPVARVFILEPPVQPTSRGTHSRSHRR
ncbi:hypothetical protein BV22DRAFT_1046989 [Leucogyrophana mollusca]|uniref:Uncharacterized protein n=1 Tax=Leucogyrophana mollusca TaxID=85980 RepID=A0ACB8BJS3_9AGAM|nr:hypothetical protein BV22DRAFT_1046989 [Leucogyrophana mollusca]